MVYQGQSHASNTARTQHCLVVTGDELVRYLKMRGVAGTAEEILEVVHARLNLSSRTGFERLVSGVHDCSFLRPAVRPLASMLLRPGPERREVKLRQRWRRKDDSMRPTGMKGAAHRGGGAAKRRDKSRDIGHNGGALARAQRREKAKARGKKRRVRVVAATRCTSAAVTTTRILENSIANRF